MNIEVHMKQINGILKYTMNMTTQGYGRVHEYSIIDFLIAILEK